LPELAITFLTAPPGQVFGLNSEMLIAIAQQLFNALVLFVVLRFLLYKPVRNFLQKRTDRIKNQLEKAENDMSKANALKGQYEQDLAGIEQERFDILETAQQVAKEKSRTIVHEGKQEATALMNRALSDIENEQAQAKMELKQHIVELSAVMASKFVSQVMDQATQDRLFAETLAELEEAPWPN
jgi:F-type H+-transporting ATPase subunit b